MPECDGLKTSLYAPDPPWNDDRMNSRFNLFAGLTRPQFLLRGVWVLSVIWSFVPTLGLGADAAKPVRVLVWDERQPAQKQAYSNFLGNEIAD